MKSRTTQSFRDALASPPKTIRDRARAAYRRFRKNPHQRRLQFKQVHAKRSIYSVRINDDYRALGVLDGEDIVWYWIGKHEVYERLLRKL